MSNVCYMWGMAFRRAQTDKYAWGASFLLFWWLLMLDGALLFASLMQGAEEWGEYAKMLFYFHPHVSGDKYSSGWFLFGVGMVLPFIFRFITFGHAKAPSFGFFVGGIRCALICVIVGAWFQFGLLFNAFSDWLFFASCLAIFFIMYGRKEDGS